MQPFYARPYGKHGSMVDTNDGTTVAAAKKVRKWAAEKPPPGLRIDG